MIGMCLLLRLLPPEECLTAFMDPDLLSSFWPVAFWIAGSTCCILYIYCAMTGFLHYFGNKLSPLCPGQIVAIQNTLQLLSVHFQEMKATFSLFNYTEMCSRSLFADHCSDLQLHCFWCGSWAHRLYTQGEIDPSFCLLVIIYPQKQDPPPADEACHNPFCLQMVFVQSQLCTESDLRCQWLGDASSFLFCSELLGTVHAHYLLYCNWRRAASSTKAWPCNQPSDAVDISHRMRHSDKPQCCLVLQDAAGCHKGSWQVEKRKCSWAGNHWVLRYVSFLEVVVD